MKSLGRLGSQTSMRAPIHDHHPYKFSVFDPQRVEKQIAKSQSRAIAILDILAQLINRGTRPINEARDALQGGQPRQAAFVVHNLNNSLGNFGGMRVCDVAADIEYFLESDCDNGNINALFDVLEIELTRFFSHAEVWLISQKKLMQNAFNLTVQSIDQQLAEFQVQLNDADLSALENFERLQSYFTEQLPSKQLRLLDQLIKRLDFASALKIIQHETEEKSNSR